MHSRSTPAVGGKRSAQGSRVGETVLVWIAAVIGAAYACAQVGAQVPTPSREELMRQWDINHDGKVDASEAEIARGRMRRARTEAMMNSGNDPLTGKPRVATDPLTGRVLPSATTAGDRDTRAALEEDDGLILVPGNGDRPESVGNSSAGRDMSPRPPRREGEALPGTRAPSVSSTIPSVSPRMQTVAPTFESETRSPGTSSSSGPRGPSVPRDAGNAELSSRSRLLPGMSPQQTPGGRDPQSPRAGRDQSLTGPGPGVISGGMRPGPSAARIGPGGVPPAGDLNAGRLPGGLPQTRGTAPGTISGPRIGQTQQPNAGRLAGPVPSMPRPGIGPYRGSPSPRPATAGATSPGVPSLPQPGVRQPDGGRPMSRAPSTVPRVPRMTTDEFYGR